MVNFLAHLKAFLTASPVIIALMGMNSLFYLQFATPASAQDGGGQMGVTARGAGIDDLLALLATPDLAAWEDVEAKIRVEWARSGSHSVDLLLKRALDALEAGKGQVALEHATAMTDHAPDFAEGWNTLAKAYFQAGYYGPALDALQRTIALNADHYEAFAGLGTILGDLGDEDAALQAFRASAAIHPHQPHISATINELEARTGGEKI